MVKQKVVVIGGGVAGLAVSALLAKRGHLVTLFEKNSQFGGRARSLSLGDFRFDMGPSWYMMPEVFEDYFKLFGQKPSDYYRLISLNPRYRVFFEGGPTVDLLNNTPSIAKVFNTIDPGSYPRLERLLAKLNQVYDLSTRRLMSHPAKSIIDYLRPSLMPDLFKLITQINPFESYHNLITRYISHPQLQQLLEFPTVFLGGSPYLTPALYSILIPADYRQKIWYPMGGMSRLVEALLSLCGQQKVDLKLNAPVDSININAGRAVSVTVGHQVFKTDIVVSAADYHHTETKLLPPQFQAYPAAYWQKATPSISAILLYLGLKQPLPGTLHHNLYFCRNWRSNFDAIFKTASLPVNPSYYLSVRTKSDPTLAPKKFEELFALFPVSSALVNQTLPPHLMDYLINHLETTLGVAIKPHLIVKKLYGPADFAADYNSFSGSALGLAHTLTQSLWSRPVNRSSKVNNLYYTGQMTNPGIGLPMCLVSATIVDKLISYDS